MANISLKATFLFMWLLLFAATAVSQCSGNNFSAPLNLDPGTSPSDVAAADFNGDGRADLVFINATNNTISVFLGSPIGVPTAIRITSVQNPVAVATADFNHDGKLDLAVTHDTFGSQFVAILLGDGAGNFGAPTDFAASLTKPIVAADFNGDGNVDVFVGSQSTNNSQVLLGNGSGGLAAAVLVMVPNNTDAVARDLNGDGKVDLVLVNSGISLSVALGNGDGTFGAGTSLPVQATSVALADFDADGKLDILAGQNNGISIVLGNGAGGFGAPNTFSTGFTISSVAVGDLDGDGKMDVAAVGGINISVLIGDGAGKLGPHTDYPLTQTPFKVVMGDFNGDGKLDAATANKPPSLPPLGGPGPSDRGTIVFGNGAGKLQTAAILTGLSPFSVDRGDLNGDGFVDLVVANISNNNVSVWLGSATGAFGNPTTVAVGTQPRSVALADLNGDRKLDLITANFDAGTVSVLLGNGQGGFSPPVNIGVPGFNPEYATIGDFNNDGKPDVVVAYLNSTFLSVLLGNGAGGFATAINSPVPTGAQQVVMGDFNGDGKTDLAIPNISGLSILLGTGTGTFSATTIPTSSTAISVATGDFNSDGKLDLVSSVGNENRTLLLLGDGQGNFIVTATLAGAGSIAVADYDGDGNSDLAVAASGSVSLLLGDGAGSFGSARMYQNGGGVTRAVVAGDFNSDGRADLVFANQGGFPSSFSPNVSIIFNACSAVPAPIPTISMADVAVTETDGGSINATLAITLSNPSNKTVGVSFYTADKEATKGLDYQSTSGRISFAPGVTTQNLTIPILGDTMDEFDERFNMFIVFPANASAGAPATVTILDNDPPPTISISDASVVEGNSGTTPAIFALSLSAASGKPITVQYVTADGTAVAGSDYVAASGSVVIPAGSSSSTFSISVVGDTSLEPNETFLVNLVSVDNATLAKGQAVCTILNDDNIIDQPDFFVKQHYLDFLNRQPDQSGLDFWTNQITSCGSDADCIEVKRINVSAAFFLSIEFQQTGNLVYKMYKAAFGNLSGKPVAVERAPFLADTRQIQSTPVQIVVGQGDWQAQLEANKQSFALTFVQRSAFQTTYAGKDAATYVSMLFQNAGVNPTATETSAAINAFDGAGGGDAGRASALRSVCESNSVSTKLFNEAFVLMQYFGYLQRNPYDPPEPTLDYQGYNFWLNKLNSFNGDFIAAEMVKAFISSGEYRQRFGP